MKPLPVAAPNAESNCAFVGVVSWTSATDWIVRTPAVFPLTTPVAVIAPVKSFLDKGKIYELPIMADGGISMKLRAKLIDIQCGNHPAPEGWLYPVKNLQ
jgi:hypothetical protein